LFFESTLWNRELSQSLVSWLIRVPEAVILGTHFFSGFEKVVNPASEGGFFNPGVEGLSYL